MCIKHVLDERILEGELLKYKPGLNFNHIKRWVQLTKDEIRYHKTRWDADCWDTKPLFSINIKDIVGSYR